MAFKAKIPADRTSTGINLILDMRIEDQLMKDFAEFADGKRRFLLYLILQKQLIFIN